MSVEAITWAFAQDGAPGDKLAPGDKFLLVAIANIVNEAGIGFPGRERLAEMTGWDRATVSRHLKALEERRLIARAERRRANGSRTSDWTVVAPGRCAASRAPIKSPLRDDDFPAEVMALLEPPDDGCVSSGDDLQGDDLPPGQVALSRSPEPSEEPSDRTSSFSDRARELAGDLSGLAPPEMAADANSLLVGKARVDGRVVTAREIAVAAAALAEFNRQAGSDYGLGAHLTPLVMRSRERPSWDAATFVRLVQSAFRIRWWERRRRGDAGGPRRVTPQVVFGNPRCFENVVQDAVDEKAGRGAEVELRRGRFVRSRSVEDDG